ncbi:MAG: hypothetical protein BWY09_00346 [Candidatus Hydrogenedentes bacterium ADurb.Bin179]|nr:MAG: hypothetical protein BWY09_00346 [Candidatus Hydrogenedentes bacterium ADurb.Bin179]
MSLLQNPVLHTANKMYTTTAMRMIHGIFILVICVALICAENMGSHAYHTLRFNGQNLNMPSPQSFSAYQAEDLRCG